MRSSKKVRASLPKVIASVYAPLYVVDARDIVQDLEEALSMLKESKQFLERSDTPDDLLARLEAFLANE